MSEILNKDMEIPKSCFKGVSEHCPFYADCKALRRFCDIHDNTEIINTIYTGRLDDCPLVEVPTHGRLIDADVLKANLRLGVIIDSFKGRYKQIANFLVDEICSAIDESPSIIEGRTCWSCRESTDHQYFEARN